MMTDLVKRLREYSTVRAFKQGALFTEAADAILDRDLQIDKKDERISELERKIEAIKMLPSYYLECPTGEFDQMTSATEIMNILSPVSEQNND